jgi:hypothetical protein
MFRAAIYLPQGKAEVDSSLVYFGWDLPRTIAPGQFAKPTGGAMIRKLVSGGFRLYSRKINPKTGKRRNLGTFKTRAAAEKHEREVQFFKRQ